MPIMQRELHFMPFILVVLFIIALLITLAGLFLSPHTPARRPQREYLTTPRSRRGAEATSIPARTRRMAPASSSQTAPVRRRASALIEGANRESLSVYQARSGARRTSGGFARPVQPTGGRSNSASVAYPGSWDALKERLGTWQVAVPGLIAIFLLGFYLLNTILPYPLLWMPPAFGSAN